VTVRNNERYLRGMLSDKVSGSLMGLWLLVPEYLRLGGWDLVRRTLEADAQRSFAAAYAGDEQIVVPRVVASAPKVIVWSLTPHHDHLRRFDLVFC
jgi:hypothetical protein